MLKDLFLEERRQGIVDLVREQRRVSVAELSRRFGVSGVTIRNDLEALSAQYPIVRTHGGAILLDRVAQELSFEARRRQQPAEKRRIGQAAAALVADGEAIVLDTSSTALNIALHLKDRRELTIITNSLAIAQELLDTPGIAVVMPGGHLRRDSLSLVGTDGIEMLREYNVQKGFFGAHGLTIEEGLTDVSITEAEVKRALVGLCRQVIAALDATKLGQVGVASFAAAHGIHTLITDQRAAPELIAAFEAVGMRITMV